MSPTDSAEREPGMLEHRLVIGPGGSGRSRLLQRWTTGEAVESDEAGPASGLTTVWLIGSPLQRVDAAAVQEALGGQPDLLIVDDLQWCDESALKLLIDRVGGQQGEPIAMWASRRPWPISPTIRLLDDLLTQKRPADRTVPLSVEELGAMVAARQGSPASGDLVERLHTVTAGSPGLTDDCVASGWDGDLASLPESLVDAILSRVRRAGDAALALAEVLAVDPGVDMVDAGQALPAELEADDAERSARAGGLVDHSGVLIPVIGAAVLRDQTAGEQAAIHDRLAIALATASPDRADEHLLAGSNSTPEAAEALLRSAVRLRAADPARALDLLHRADASLSGSIDVAMVRAEALFHLGSTESSASLERIGPDGHERAPLLSFGLDVRDLRWAQAADREIPGDLGQCLAGLAVLAQGRGVEPGSESSTPTVEVVSKMVDGIIHLSRGDLAPSLGALAAASDDFDRLKPDLPLGITPHFLAALASLLSGDLQAADDLLELAVANESGRAGEASSHRLLLAYGRVLDGRYADALELVRAGEVAEWQQRDRFLLAALDAALARRSGDTARLREAWDRVDPVLVRLSPSWLLLDPLTELLAAGTRLGHHQRVDPLLESILDQCRALPPGGPARVGAAWLELQLAIASNDADRLIDRAGQVSELEASDRRSEARVAAGRVWAELGQKSVDFDDVSDVAQQLAAVGEPWEASRLVGQAALDVADTSVARKLLELARQFVVEPGEADGGDGLVALGLSEREADVARLVAEGRTHKEVGAQLYISPKTVEHHVAKIRQKLGVSSRADMLATIRSADSSTEL